MPTFIDDFQSPPPGGWGNPDDNLGSRTGWTFQGNLAQTLQVREADKAVSAWTVQQDLYFAPDFSNNAYYIEAGYVASYGIDLILCYTDINNHIAFELVGTGGVGFRLRSIVGGSITTHYQTAPAAATRWRVSIGDGAPNNLRVYADSVEVGGSPFTNTAPLASLAGLRGRSALQTPVWDYFEHGTFDVGFESEIDTAWRIATLADQSTAWRLQADKTLDTAWRVQVGKTLDTAWRVQIGKALDTAWRVSVGKTLDTAWRILTGGASQINTAWRIQTSSEQPTAWRVQIGKTLDTAWQIIGRQISQLATAWRIQTSSEIDTGWRIQIGKTLATAWRIAVFKTLNTAWRIGLVETRPSITLQASKRPRTVKANSRE